MNDDMNEWYLLWQEVNKAGTPAGEAIVYKRLVLARREVIIIGWILLREKPYLNGKVTPMARLCHIKCKGKAQASTRTARSHY